MPYSVYPHTTSHHTIAPRDSTAPQNIPSPFLNSMKKPLKILHSYIYQSKILLEEVGRKNTNISKISVAKEEVK